MKRSRFLLIFLIFAVGAVQAEPDKKARTGLNNPCRSIRVACEDAGFVMNDNNLDNRVIKNCMVKMVTGQPAISPATGKEAQVPSGVDLNACAAQIHHGKKSTIGMKSRHIVKASSTAQILK